MLKIIKVYMKKDCNFVLKHTFCEMNACANIIAKMEGNYLDYSY
jgi:hypothetical protein